MGDLRLNNGGIKTNKEDLPSIDLRYGPYESVQAAHAALAKDELCAIGLTVGIIDGDNIVEYWYQGDTAQSNLVPKGTAVEGPKGDFKSRAFTRTDYDISELTPEGGSYDAPVPNTTSFVVDEENESVTWHDGVPHGSGMLWSTTCIFKGDGSKTTWSNPSREVDTIDLDIEFSPMEEEPSVNTLRQQPGKPHPGSDTDKIWYDPEDEDFGGKKMIWRAERKIENGRYVGAWVITRIYGEKGNTPVVNNWTIGNDGYWYCNGELYKDNNGNPIKAEGTGIELKGTVDYALQSELPNPNPEGKTALPEEDSAGLSVGDCYMVKSNGWLYFYDGVTDHFDGGNGIPASPAGWVPVGKIKGENAEQMYLHIAWAKSITFNSELEALECTGFVIQREKSDTEEYDWMGICTDTNIYDPGDIENRPEPRSDVAFRSYKWNNVKGQQGIPGQTSYVGTAYCRTNFNMNSSKYVPTGGSFASPMPNPVAYTYNDGTVRVEWSDGIPDGEQTLWETRRIFTSDEAAPQQTSWSIPRKVEDTQNYDVEFAFEQKGGEIPATPTDSNRHGGDDDQIWFDPSLDKDSLPEHTSWSDMVWRAERECVNGEWSDWVITRIKGETGPGYKLVIQKDNFNEQEWNTTYGKKGTTRTWAGTSSLRGDCGINDWFLVVGYATDTLNYHQATYECTNTSGDLEGTCIAHQITKDGKNAIRLDIDNEYDAVQTDEANKIKVERTVSTIVRLYNGPDEINISSAAVNTSSDGLLINVTDMPDSSAASFAPSAEKNGGYGKVLSWTFQNTKIMNDAYDVDISLEYNGVTYNAVFTIVASKGNPVYQLKPSYSALPCTINENNNTYNNPPALSLDFLKVNAPLCEQVSATKANLTKYGVTVIYSTASMPTSKTPDSTHLAWPDGGSLSAGTITSSHTNVYIAMFNSETGVLLDRETVPVLKNGKPGDGIESITTRYGISAEGTTANESTAPSDLGAYTLQNTKWEVNSPEATKEKPYLWRCEIVDFTYKTDTVKYYCVGKEGFNGVDGVGSEWVYVRTKTNVHPVIMDEKDSYNKTYEVADYLPKAQVANTVAIKGNTHYDSNGFKQRTIDGRIYNIAECTDDPQGVSEEWPYEWEAYRKSEIVDGVATWKQYAINTPTMHLSDHLSESLLTIDIDNDNDQFGTDSDSRVITAQTRSTNVTMYYGTELQAFTIQSAKLYYDNGDQVPTVNAPASATYEMSADSKKCKVTVNIPRTPDNVTTMPFAAHEGLYVNIIGSCNNQPRNIVFTIAKHKSGKPGVSPVLYQLAFKDTAFSFNRTDANILSPNVLSTTVGLAITNDSGTDYKYENVEGHSFTWGFVQGDNDLPASEENKPIGNQIIVRNTDAVTYSKVWVQLDDEDSGERESLPILKDGMNGIQGDPGETYRIVFTFDGSNASSRTAVSNIPSTANYECSYSNTTKLYAYLQKLVNGVWSDDANYWPAVRYCGSDGTIIDGYNANGKSSNIGMDYSHLNASNKQSFAVYFTTEQISAANTSSIAADKIFISDTIFKIPAGAPGTNGVQLTLDNQFEYFLYDEAGNLIDPVGGATCQAHLYDGNVDMKENTGVSWSIYTSGTSGVVIDNSNSPYYAKVSNTAGSKGLITVKGINASSAKVTVIASYKNGEYYGTFNMKKTIGDKYSIILTPDAIAYNRDEYEGVSISVIATGKAANGKTINSTINFIQNQGNLRVFWAYVNGNGTLGEWYRLTSNTFNVTSDECEEYEGIHFELRWYNSSSTLDSSTSSTAYWVCDYETVEIAAVENGKPGANSIRLAIDNEHEDFLYNSDGELIAPKLRPRGENGVRVQATLYDGATPIPGGNVGWNIDTSKSSGTDIENYGNPTTISYTGDCAYIGPQGELDVVGLTGNSAKIVIRAKYPNDSTGQYYYNTFTANKTSQNKYDLVINPSSIAYNPADYSQKTIYIYANVTDLQGNTTYANINDDDAYEGELTLWATYVRSSGASARTTQITDCIADQDNQGLYLFKVPVNSQMASLNDGIYIELREYTDSTHYVVKDYETVEIAKVLNGSDAYSCDVMPKIMSWNTDENDIVEEFTTKSSIAKIYCGDQPLSTDITDASGVPLGFFYSLSSGGGVNITPSNYYSVFEKGSNTNDFIYALGKWEYVSNDDIVYNSDGEAIGSITYRGSGSITVRMYSTGSTPSYNYRRDERTKLSTQVNVTLTLRAGNIEKAIDLVLIPNRKGDTGDVIEAEPGKMGRTIYYAGNIGELSGVGFTVTDTQAPYVSTDELNSNGTPKCYVFTGENGEDYEYGDYASYYETPGNWGIGEKWEPMTSDFKYLITEAVFSDYAKLGSGVFNGDFAFSQYGTIDGEESTDYQNCALGHRYSGIVSNNAVLLLEIPGDNSSKKLRLEIDRPTNYIGFHLRPINSSSDIKYWSGDTASQDVETGVLPAGMTFYLVAERHYGSGTVNVSAQIMSSVFMPNLYIDWKRGELYSQYGRFVNAQITDAQIVNASIESIINNFHQTITTDNLTDFGEKNSTKFYIDPLKFGGNISWNVPSDTIQTLVLPCAYSDGVDAVLQPNLDFVTLENLRKCIGKKIYFEASIGNIECGLNNPNQLGSDVEMLVVKNGSYSWNFGPNGTINNVSAGEGGDLGIMNSSNDTGLTIISDSYTRYYQYNPNSSVGSFVIECKLGTLNGYECIYWELLSPLNKL